jgi:hypothetical protein
MATYKFASVPSKGERITYQNGRLGVPTNPIIPYVEGDGTGADIWRASVRVFDAAIEKAYGGERRVSWMEVFAGEKAFTKCKDWLPQETVDAMQEFRVSIKGPLTTPVGGGIRSLNVTLRQVLDLYACIRPVRYFEGVGSPMKHPEQLNIVVFRENTEDVYAGIEWKAGSPEAEKLRLFIEKEFGKKIREQSAIGIKPMSAFGSKRLIEMAYRFAIKQCLPSVTLMHKGNIMKFTEGALRAGAREVRQRHRVRSVSRERRSRGARRCRDRQGSHCRLDVPAVAAASRRVLRDRDAQPERRLCLRRRGGAGRWAGHCAGRKRRRWRRRLRGHPWNRPKVCEPRQDQPGERDSLRRDDVRLPGVDRGGGADRARAGKRHQIPACHVRSGPTDAGSQRSLDVGIRRSDHQGNDSLTLVEQRLTR